VVVDGVLRTAWIYPGRLLRRRVVEAVADEWLSALRGLIGESGEERASDGGAASSRELEDALGEVEFE
jgi:hypothetical protein